MYIKEIYVENFGVLSDYTYKAVPGLNQICGSNGSGKSTLAVFIRAMFYGLPNNRNRKYLDDAIRKKYKPWQNGRYGGYIIFNSEGINYRLLRFFGDKDKDDEFSLYNEDTGKISNDYTADIGHELFGVDEGAFLAAAWISGKNMEIAVNDSIHTKLSGISGKSQENVDYSKALDALEEAKKRYVKTGRRGLIAIKEDEISELEVKLSELNKIYINNSIVLEQAKLKHDKEPDNTGENKKKSYAAEAVLLVILAISIVAEVISFFIDVSPVARIVILLLAAVILFALAVSFVKTNAKNREVYKVKLEAEMQKKLDLELENKQLSDTRAKQDMLLAQINGIKVKIKECENELSEYKKRYDVFEKTAEYLKKAKESYAHDYISDIVSGINSYLMLFDEDLAVKIKVDEDLNVFVKDRATLKEMDYLSSGYKDIIRLCERFAVIDALFVNEKTVVVLDDPFVNLDMEMMQKAQRIIKNIASRYQVIYMTCRQENMLQKQ